MTLPCGHTHFRENHADFECKVCDAQHLKCEMWNCNKIATIEIPSIDWESGEEEPLHACEECAAKLGWSS